MTASALPRPTTRRSVSVVVPVGRIDAATMIQLAAIRRLDLDQLDVELVLSLDTGSTDDDAMLRAAVGDDWPTPVTIVASSAGRGAAHARNAGAAVARGDILAFCDADDVVEPGWLVHLVESLGHHDAVTGRLVELVDRAGDAGVRPPATPNALPTFLGVPYLLSGNLALHADTFRDVGGFDTTLVRCEDTALSWRLLEQGRSLGFAPDAVVHYRMRSGLWPMMRQQFMYGRGASQLLLRQGIPDVTTNSRRADVTTNGRRADRPQLATLLRANGQAGGRGSYVRLLRRGATAAGRLVGLVEELSRSRRRTDPPEALRDGNPVAARPGERVLFVADAGGHLLEADIVQQLLYPGLDTVWYTADTTMSRSLLQGRAAVFADRRVLPRRPDLAVREFVTAFRLLHDIRPDLVVSTGSAVALPWLVAAAVTGRRAIFHESAARVVAPSLTGRLIERVPRVERYTQHPMTMSPRRARRWRRSESTLELAERVADLRAHPAVPHGTGGAARRQRLFVTVGTYEYPFVRLFERLDEVVPDDWDIVWQLGHAGPYRPSRGEVHDFLDHDRILVEASEADMTITHAGVGSILTVIQAGRVPSVVPRRARHGEIADDHQLEVLPALRAVGITVFDDVDDIQRAVFTRVHPAGEAVA